MKCNNRAHTLIFLLPMAGPLIAKFNWHHEIALLEIAPSFFGWSASFCRNRVRSLSQKALDGPEKSENL